MSLHQFSHKQIKLIKLSRNEKTFFSKLVFEVVISHVTSAAETDIENFASLARKANIKILWDLNLKVRYGIQWDPSNAANLLDYIVKMKYQDVFNFEMGNGKF